MMNLNVSTMIEAPIQRVFDFMSTPENDFQWQYGTLATATINYDHNPVGVFFRSVGHLMGRRNLSTFEVIESSSNMKYKFRSLSGPLYLQTTYTFKMVDEGTKINISIRVGVLNFFEVNKRILEKWMKKQLKENLSTLKNLLEMRQFPPTSKMTSLVI